MTPLKRLQTIGQIRGMGALVRHWLGQLWDSGNRHRPSGITIPQQRRRDITTTRPQELTRRAKRVLRGLGVALSELGTMQVGIVPAPPRPVVREQTIIDSPADKVR